MPNPFDEEQINPKNIETMKKILIAVATLVALMASSCGNMLGTTGANGNNGGTLGDVLGSVLGGLGGANMGNSLLNMVIGYIKIDQRELYGTWQYTAPGCAFTSEQLLAKAGGAVAAGQVKEKLAPIYSSVGISGNNTYFVFTQDGKFQAKVNGIPLSGTYTYDKENCAIKMQSLLTVTGYLTRTTSGMALTFESKKLLSVLQAVTALSGNSTIKTVGDLSKEFDGVRVGFEMAKTN